MKKNDRKIAGMRSEAVEKATGKGWEKWFAVLDKAEASKKNHKDIAVLLHKKHGVSGWWSQMITVGYEQARGLRKAHESPQGFQISKSKTISVSPAKVFRAWNDKKARDSWLGEDIIVRKATPGKSIRITWSDEKTNVDVNLYSKNKDKCRVSVQHSKLPSAAKAGNMKKYWGGQLEKLKEYLNG